MATRMRKLGGLSEAVEDDTTQGELADYQKSRRWSVLRTVAVFGGIIIALRIGELTALLTVKNPGASVQSNIIHSSV